MIMQTSRYVLSKLASQSDASHLRMIWKGCQKYYIPRPTLRSISSTIQLRSSPPETVVRKHLTDSAPEVARHITSRKPRVNLRSAFGRRSLPTLTINGKEAWYGEPEGLYVGDENVRSWLYLRDLCTCPRCVDSSTRQRLFEFSDIPDNICAKQVLNNDGQININWENDIPGYDSHKTVLSEKVFADNLHNLDFTGDRHSRNCPPKLWNRATLQENQASLTFKYSDYMTSRGTLFRAVHKLLAYGLIFVEGVPKEVRSVKAVSERIGPIRNTFYGETWDVRSVPSAVNVAYTSQHLGFHQDLLYMAEPPFLQFLHVMKASSSGGRSLFVDTVSAFKKMMQEDWHRAMHLANVPITYHYRNNGHFYEYTRRHVEGPFMTNSGGDDKIKPFRNLLYPRDYHYINYSPPFQGPLQTNFNVDLKTFQVSQTMQDYRKALARFREIIEDPENIFETKLDEGTCVVFNNRRILHARTAFESSEGERWLRGAYVDQDPLMSLFRRMDEENSISGGTLDPAKFEEDRKRRTQSQGWYLR